MKPLLPLLPLLLWRSLLLVGLALLGTGIAQPARDIARPDACIRSATIKFGSPVGGLYNTLAPVAGATLHRDNLYPASCGWGERGGVGNVPLVFDIGGPAYALAVATRARNELAVLTGGGSPTLHWIDPELRDVRLSVPLPVVANPAFGQLLPHQEVGLVVLIGANIFRLAPKGGIEYQSTLPAGVAWDGLAVFPDGNLLITGGTTGPGCLDATGFARWRCPGTTFGSGRALLLDPTTFRVLQDIALPETAYGLPAVTIHHSKQLAYLCGAKHLMRLQYDGNRLIWDKTWLPEYVRRSQLPGNGPSVLGNFVTAHNNAAPAGEPLSVIVVSQDDPAKITGLRPFADLPDSYAPAALAVDPERNLIYIGDARCGQLAAVSFAPASGKVKIHWRVPQQVAGGLLLIGDLADRTLLSTDGDHRGTSLVWRDGNLGTELMRVSKLPVATDGLPPIPSYSSGAWLAGMGMVHVKFSQP